MAPAGGATVIVSPPRPRRRGPVRWETGGRGHDGWGRVNVARAARTENDIDLLPTDGLPLDAASLFSSMRLICPIYNKVNLFIMCGETGSGRAIWKSKWQGRSRPRRGVPPHGRGTGSACC